VGFHVADGNCRLLQRPASGVGQGVGEGDTYCIVGDNLICSGTAYTREEIEQAAMATVFDVEYLG